MDVESLGKIGVLAGGPSNERPISLESGTAVLNALKGTGLNAVFIDVKKELTKEEIRELGIDVAFIALHGRFGEDGTIQRMLEECHIPYTGSGPLASGLALDKIASRELFIKNGIDVPRYTVIPAKAGIHKNKMDCRFRGHDMYDWVMKDIGFPLVVKPQFEGSSIGISIVKDQKDLPEAINTAFHYGDNILVEEYIRGRELTVGILDDEPLPVIEIVVKEQFYNFNAKYHSPETEYIVPAKIDEDIYKRAQETGRSAHLALGCETFSRVDMIWDQKSGRLVVLEVNSIPGFTSHSLLPKAAAFTGVDFVQLCVRITEAALKKGHIKSEKVKI
jgi:D-alanine-D-alanine ligase